MHSVVYLIFYNVIVEDYLVDFNDSWWAGRSVKHFFLILCLDNKIMYRLGMVLYTFSPALRRQRQEEL